MRELTPARRCAISGFRRALRNIPLVCGGLLAGLILAEVGLRILGITYPVFDAYDATRGIALKPGKQGWYYGEGGAYVKINAWIRFLTSELGIVRNESQVDIEYFGYDFERL